MWHRAFGSKLALFVILIVKLLIRQIRVWPIRLFAPPHLLIRSTLGTRLSIRRKHSSAVRTDRRSHKSSAECGMRSVELLHPAALAYSSSVLRFTPIST